MKEALRHKILATLLTIVVLFPIALQASHALDNHEHTVCTAKNEKHFHAKEIDCCLCCTPIELNSLLFSLDSDIFNPKILIDSSKAISQLTTFTFFKLKSSRAPPSLSSNY